VNGVAGEGAEEKRKIHPQMTQITQMKEGKKWSRGEF